MAPVAFEIDGIHQLKKEHFPVLHVARYDAADLEKVVAAINGTGYGLTLGVHSRTRKPPNASSVWRGSATFTSTATRSVRWWACHSGGCGLSGTGPKAGGLSYLLRFANERTTSTNTTAVGGNARCCRSATTERVVDDCRGVGVTGAGFGRNPRMTSTRLSRQPAYNNKLDSWRTLFRH